MYVKFTNRDEEHVFTDIFHATPRYFGVYVGRDRFYPAFNGDLKGWLF